MADALDSKSSPSNRVSVQVRSPVLLNTKGLAVVFRESFLAFKNSEFYKTFFKPHYNRLRNGS